MLIDDWRHSWQRVLHRSLLVLLRHDARHMRTTARPHGGLGANHAAVEADRQVASVQSPVSTHVHEAKESAMGSGRLVLRGQTPQGHQLLDQAHSRPHGHDRVRFHHGQHGPPPLRENDLAGQRDVHVAFGQRSLVRQDLQRRDVGAGATTTVLPHALLDLRTPQTLVLEQVLQASRRLAAPRPALSGSHRRPLQVRRSTSLAHLLSAHRVHAPLQALRSHCRRWLLGYYSLSLFLFLMLYLSLSLSCYNL